MATAESVSLNVLYERDETAWLEAMAELIRLDRLDQLDYSNLAGYLADMARRDRREVTSRLSILIAHLLKWHHQPEKRSGSWMGTVEIQRQELAELLESGVLRNHAGEILDKAYANGIKQAVAETGLPESTFPVACPYSLDALLSEPLSLSQDNSIQIDTGAR
ncbi:MAG: DUF29 domain-containing protein [Isosphaeraceae bacterium]